MDDKLVRLSDVVDELNEWYAMYPDSDIAREALALAKRSIRKLLAVDAVEVVRCWECKYNAQPPDKGFAQCELDALIREPEFWCRAGQRREEAHNGE